MPEIVITPDTTPPVNLPTPAPAGDELVPMVTGKLRREKGRAVLTLDVSKLHSYLEFLGVTKETQYKRFSNAPASRSDVVDNVNHALVPKALCSFDYKADAPGTLEIDLLRHYTVPPTEPTLRQIAESVKDAAIAVVTHYQPVEISISIVGKKPR
jgi:hypothetical protein